MRFEFDVLYELLFDKTARTEGGRLGSTRRDSVRAAGSESMPPSFSVPLASLEFPTCFCSTSTPRLKHPTPQIVHRARELAYLITEPDPLIRHPVPGEDVNTRKAFRLEIPAFGDIVNYDPPSLLNSQVTWRISYTTLHKVRSLPGKHLNFTRLAQWRTRWKIFFCRAIHRQLPFFFSDTPWRPVTTPQTWSKRSPPRLPPPTMIRL